MTHVHLLRKGQKLLDTGNMDRAVELKIRSGEYIPSFVSLDKLTNKVVSVRVDSAFIPDEIKGVLTDDEKQALRDGFEERSDYRTARPCWSRIDGIR